MFSLIGNLRMKALGPKTPHNSENDPIRIFALLTRKKVVSFLPLWHTLLAPSSGGSPYLPACYVFIQLKIDVFRIILTEQEIFLPL